MSELRLKPRILVLSAGSLVGLNFLESMQKYRSNYELLATNSLAEVPHLTLFDQFYLFPATSSDAFLGELRVLLEQENPDLVIPCRDQDVVALAILGESQPVWRDRFLCGSVALAHIFADQWLSFEFARAQDMSFAPTILASADKASLSAFLSEVGFPLVLKPRRGFASQQVRLISQAQIWLQLEQTLQEPEAFVLQKYLGSSAGLRAFERDLSTCGIPLFYSLESPKYSLQILLSPQQKVLSTFVGLHQMEGGRSWQIEVCPDPALQLLASQVALKCAEAGWRGPLNIQCLKDSQGRYWIHEFNGRLTGATSARQLLGTDEVGLILQHFVYRDKVAALSVYSPPEPGSRVYRQLQSVLFPSPLNTGAKDAKIP